MPRLTRYFIKTALIYLALSLVLGAVLAARAVFDLPAELAALSPVFFHLFMVGWVTQLIFGMLFWMLPKSSKELPRGNEQLAWAAYVLINCGLVLRVIGEPLTALRADWGPGWLLGLSALLQLVGGWAFIANAWPRVKVRQYDSPERVDGPGCAALSGGWILDRGADADAKRRTL